MSAVRNRTVGRGRVRTGKNSAYIAARLKLTELASVVVEAFSREEIDVGHALLLVKLQPDQQEQALTACFKEDWSARGSKPKRSLLPSFLSVACNSGLSRITVFYDGWDKPLLSTIVITQRSHYNRTDRSGGILECIPG